MAIANPMFSNVSFKNRLGIQYDANGREVRALMRFERVAPGVPPLRKRRKMGVPHQTAKLPKFVTTAFQERPLRLAPQSTRCFTHQTKFIREVPESESQFEVIR